jgi:ubiquinone/menaquinone biosynthesis C-methylase UbiE
MIENIRKFDDFDQFAEDYREIHTKSISISGETSEYFAEFKLKWLSKKVSRESVFTFLDLGCGDGIFTQWFFKYFPNANYLGVDISAASIEIANKREIKGAFFQTYDGINIPFETDSIDYCIAACVFHHIDHSLHSQVLNEIHRVLKVGGKFYLWEHNPNNPVTRKIVAECEFDKDCELLKPSYSKNLINNGTFKSSSIDFVIFMPRGKFFNHFLFLEKYMRSIPIGAQYVLTAVK